MDFEQQQRTRWSSLVVLVVFCLLASACRVDVDAELSAHQAATVPLATPSTETPSTEPTSRSGSAPSADLAPSPEPTAVPPAPSPTAVPAAPAVPVLDASQRMGALNVRLNFWIYHRGMSVDDGSAGDLFRTHAWRKKSERLTEHGGVTELIELSPDGQWLAYLVDTDVRSLHVMDVGSRTPTDLGPVDGFGFISWSPDSREVLVNHNPGVDQSGAIHAINIADGSRRTLVESSSHSPSIAVMVDENDLVLWEIGDGSLHLVRIRLDTGERLAQLETSYLGYRAYDRDNQVLYLTRRQRDAGTVVAIDLSRQGLHLTEIPTPPNEETDVAISPDGDRVAYVNGTNQQSNELYFVDLMNPTAMLHMTLDLGGRSTIRGIKWAPASTAVVFGYGERGHEELVVVAQDGTLFPIGIPGIPSAIVPDGT